MSEAIRGANREVGPDAASLIRLRKATRLLLRLLRARVGVAGVERIDAVAATSRQTPPRSGGRQLFQSCLIAGTCCSQTARLHHFSPSVGLRRWRTSTSRRSVPDGDCSAAPCHLADGSDRGRSRVGFLCVTIRTARFDDEFERQPRSCRVNRRSRPARAVLLELVLAQLKQADIGAGAVLGSKPDSILATAFRKFESRPKNWRRS